jgi:hypothetical protein
MRTDGVKPCQNEKQIILSVSSHFPGCGKDRGNFEEIRGVRNRGCERKGNYK